MNVTFATAWFTYTSDQQQAKAPNPVLQATQLVSPTLPSGRRPIVPRDFSCFAGSVGVCQRPNGFLYISLSSKINRCEHDKLKSVKTAELLRFNGAVERNPAIDAWMKEHSGELGAIAKEWFEVMRKCGDEVRELLHDGCPVACLGDAPFGYVNVFTSHVNVGFFHGASLPDPNRLLEGAGKFMRHVKLRPGTAANAAALSRLIETAYSDIKARVENG